jgi:N6-adenine-specific methylase
VENNPIALRCFEKHQELQLEKEGLEGKVSVLVMDALQALDFLSRKGKRFDIVFLDPPYYKDLANKLLKKMADYDILFANAVVVVQHHKNDQLPKEAGFLKLFRQEKYGDSLLTFYEKE